MPPSSLQSDPDPFVQELIAFSTQVATRPRPPQSRRSEAATDTPTLKQTAWITESHLSFRPELDHAAPIMPLRDRDLAVLDEFFDHPKIQDIEADVIHNLLMRWPEPCWEDEPYEFLRDYL